MIEQPSLFDPAPAARSSGRSVPLDSFTPPASTAPAEPDHAHPLAIDTDLQLPKIGNCGNHDGGERAVLEALRAAGIGLGEIVDLLTRTVDAPPLDSADERAVRRWVDDATRRMIDPHRARRLRRSVLELLEAQRLLTYEVAEHARRVERVAADAAARAAGTYWRERDGRRTSTRPIHVDVDPSAWAAMKLDAVRGGSTVGEVVGELVRAAVHRRGQVSGQVRVAVSGPSPAHGQVREQGGRRWSGLRGRRGEGRQARVFARIAVDDDTWAAFRAIALQREVTVARAVGHLVEDNTAARSWTGHGT
ncbi:MAG: hypothetical protein ACR2LQ_11510 [Acidimicrobiales bacterium]